MNDIEISSNRWSAVDLVKKNFIVGVISPSSRGIFSSRPEFS